MNTSLDEQSHVNNQVSANEKRLQSLKRAKTLHNQRKTILKTALLNIDKTSKKIIFDDFCHEDTAPELDDVNKSQSGTKNLFADESDDDNIEVDFSLKKQFEGEEGHKLLALQSHYKNDKRFNLDERFLNNAEEQNPNDNGYVDADNDYEMSLENEKNKELEILEQVVGEQNLKQKSKTGPKGEKKLMVRFDPTQPQHSKYEIKNDSNPPKKSKEKTKKLPERLEEKKSEITDTPEVSKDVFYQVKGNLKDRLQENNQISLLSMFGHAEENGIDNVEEERSEQVETTITKSKWADDNNPFKYDSSDGEEEIETSTAHEQHNTLEVGEVTSNKTAFWVETFFFKEDDYRLQEGFDFIEKMKVVDNSDFGKARRELKEIVKIKVRNVQQKNRPFKRKLGGSKRRKNLRLKKALKK